MKVNCKVSGFRVSSFVCLRLPSNQVLDWSKKMSLNVVLEKIEQEECHQFFFLSWRGKTFFLNKCKRRLWQEAGEGTQLDELVIDRQRKACQLNIALSVFTSSSTFLFLSSHRLLYFSFCLHIVFSISLSVFTLTSKCLSLSSHRLLYFSFLS